MMPKKKPAIAGGLFQIIAARRLHAASRCRTFDITDLAARVLFPDVHHVVELGDVTFFVIGHVAEHGREMQPGMHLLGAFLGLDRVLGLVLLFLHLYADIGLERVASLLDALLATLRRRDLG